MKAFKQQIKDFFNFYRLTWRGINYKERATAGYGPIYAMIFALIILCTIQIGDGGEFFMFFAALAAGLVGAATSVRPSLLSVAPFTDRQRIIFSFLSAVVNAIIFYLCLVLFVGFVVLFVAFMVFCMTGENVFVFGLDTPEIEVFYGSPYYDGFYFLLVAFFFFATLAITMIDKRKLRNTVGGCFVGGMEVFFLIIVNICGNVGREKPTFFFFDQIEYSMAYLSAPWALLVVMGVMLAVAIFFAVFLTIKRFKRRKF